MSYVEGRATPDSTPAGMHGEGWFRSADTSEQRAVWRSFIHSLASLHSIDPGAVGHAAYGPDGVLSVLDYWRHSLLDAAPADLVPRQLRALDWLRDNLPGDADDDPALCMGDARPGNAVLAGTEVQALVDFEVAHIGNPAADIGYCLISDKITRLLSDRPATGIPPETETWEQWSEATGRSIGDRHFWAAFGATTMCITGTRAMLTWGMPVESVDTDNIVVDEWEALIDRAAG
jgi:aminoglycoside phosphotransferase (APT) family kinase protein